MDEIPSLQMIMVPHKGLFIGDRIATWMFYVRKLSCMRPL